MVVGVPLFLGPYLAKKLRMPDHGWKIGVILFSFLASVAVLCLGPPLKLGVDLRGGVILIYEVDQSKRSSHEPLSGEEMDKLIAAIQKRVNPAGTKEVVIRKYGNQQVEIIDPVGKAEVDRLKRMISSVGDLQFRILANARDDKELIDRALAEPSKGRLYNTAGQLEAWWAPIKEGQEASFTSYRDMGIRQREVKGKRKITEVLVRNDDYNVTGKYLTKAAPDVHEGKPCVTFHFDPAGGQLFGQIHEQPLARRAHRVQLQVGHYSGRRALLGAGDPKHDL